MKQDEVQVIFRKDRSGNVTAFFPGMPCNYGRIVCYQHIGQHDEASMSYYYSTIKAKEEEYIPLLKEISGIYSDCKIMIRQRLPIGGNRESWY